MNSSSSKPVDQALTVPFATFAYRDICAPVAPQKEELPPPVPEEQKPQPPAGPTPQEINELMNRVRAEAVAETEKRLRQQYEAKSAAEAAAIRKALESFVDERKSYFSRVESEVINLAMAVSSKILHREAQVDPLLVAALVRVAVDKLQDGSSVSVRVSPATAANWRTYPQHPLQSPNITIVEDAQVSADDCFLETSLGAANFSVDAQLKEIEQGFFDLLAQRPSIK